MRDPNETHQPYEYIDDVPTIIKIDELPQYNIEDYDLNDDKAFSKYMSDLERVVRTSFEYRQMVNYLRENLDMNKCSFYCNVNNIDSTKIKIEIHHEPLGLYDICMIVYNKRRAFNESLEIEMVAKEVMYNHYNLQVGLIPLSETVHELVHNQYLFVPSTRVFGKYKEFVDAYKPWMLPEQIECLENIEEASKNYDSDVYKTILSRQYIYVDMSGAYDLPKMEDIVNMIKGRIHQIMDNPPNPNIDLPKEEKVLIQPLEFF